MFTKTMSWCIRTIFIFLFFLYVSYGRTQSVSASDNPIITDTLIQQVPVSYTSTDSVAFPAPQKWAFITQQPRDLVAVPKISFQKNNLWKVGVVAASTALLIHYDQQITDGVMNFAKNIKLNPDTKYINAITVGNTRILKVPTNVNTVGYSLGEGWIGVAIAGGFWLEGSINKNNYSKQTASDLVEGFILAAIETQLIKRTTGRESPFAATRPGGKWTPFPSFSQYQTETPSYDAFPSGHLTTMMTTVTILADNYPDNKWIKPIGYGLIAFTGLAMINTEVHWAGDYPLALALGYLNGKIITNRHKQKEKKKPVIF